MKLTEILSEGYTLKATNRAEEFYPGDPDDYTDDMVAIEITYDIINNKTGAVVGTATHGSNDYFGASENMEVTMNNGATRLVRTYGRDPQAAFNIFVKHAKTSKKYKD